MRRRTTLTTAVPVLVALGLLAACSSSGSATTTPTTVAGSTTTVAGPTTTASGAGATTTAPTTSGNAACHVADATVPAAKDVGNSRDWDITSFDGTVIRAHWFPVAGASAAKPAPTLLMGPGWGSAGDTNTAAPGLLGAISIHTLTERGYNVLTWDPRGFGASTGLAEVDKPQFEGRDVTRLISWVAAQPGVQLDQPGDPRMGMVGASYGGGIQFVTAEQDCRVDAIVPIIAWHSLTTSLFKADTPKSGWAGLLMLAAAAAHLEPTIKEANAAAGKDGTFTKAEADFFAASGPADLVKKIEVPTLIIQGTVDTLFTLDEAVSNYLALQSVGTPVSMLWFCGGHGVCLTPAGSPSLVGDASTAWLDRYVKGDTSAPTVAGFEWVDQHGTAWTLPSYGHPDQSVITTSKSEHVLQLVATGGAGPSTATSADKGIVSKVALGITPGKATNAVNVAVPSTAVPMMLLGAPQLTITYSGTVAAGPRPERIFAQLVDDSTGLVLGNQITPVPVTLDGASHTLTVPLEMVAHLLAPGESLTLQLVATTVAYAQPRLGGSVTFTSIQVALPAVTGATKA